MPEGTTTLAQPNAAQHGLSAFPETRLEMKDTLFWVALVKILLNDSISCFKSIPSHHVSRMADVFHFHLQTLRISKRQCAAQQESLRFFYRKKRCVFPKPDAEVCILRCVTMCHLCFGENGLSSPNGETHANRKPKSKQTW